MPGREIEDVARERERLGEEPEEELREKRKKALGAMAAAGKPASYAKGLLLIVGAVMVVLILLKFFAGA
ncbi:MAG: hypothetical protein V1834_00415 [Candidatus Micrarchaeota archaeon]